MATRLFEGKDHAVFYQKYRFSVQENLRKLIFSFMERKVKSFGLAVDVGCGSGQCTHLLAKRFDKVIGTDISEAQIEEAKAAPHPENVSYLACPAEEVPVEDHSVDLVAAFTAAHWFDIPRFMKEVRRILKPSGCMILSSNTLDMRLHYGDCSEKLTEIFREFLDQVAPYASEKVQFVMSDYKEIFDAVPFQDKERITDIFDKVPMTVAELIGYIQSFSTYQTFLKAQPEKARSLVQNSEQRIMETMGVTSRETPLYLCTRHVCVLACRSSEK
ncbi:putative methyltransferase DDB_G0268948 [Sceloporus undulatus]|uniref:putative methyltransferase DDB_G0268948 n=1 Tax=Sceloporus undulatus TaxID=8520 RepID=UPI001C4BF4F4|nr:putative methyltransferase DDB_G0268948 [Sceloporus undulatus]